MKKIVIIIILIVLLIINYIKNRNIIILINKININLNLNNPISCMTYNIQRLPYSNKSYPVFLKKNDYDIVCLQEYFQNIIYSRVDFLKKLDYNICIPSSISPFKWDSGLVILSKFEIKFIDLIPFKINKSIDKLCEKGFLIVKIGDLYVINTHLQANYNDSNKYNKIIKSQLKQIENYIIDNLILNECLLLGDFNFNLKKINLNKKINLKLISGKINTNWNNTQNDSTKYKKYLNQNGINCDGGFITNNKLKVSDINNVDIDKYTDHLGLSFKLRL